MVHENETIHKGMASYKLLSLIIFSDRLWIR